MQSWLKLSTASYVCSPELVELSELSSDGDSVVELPVLGPNSGDFENPGAGNVLANVGRHSNVL